MDYKIGIKNADMSAYVEKMLSNEASLKETLCAVTEWLTAGLDGKSKRPGSAPLVRYMMDADSSSRAYVFKDAPEFHHLAKEVNEMVKYLERTLISAGVQEELLEQARETLRFVNNSSDTFVVAHVYCTILFYFEFLRERTETYRILHDLATMRKYSGNKEELSAIVAQMCECWE